MNLEVRDYLSSLPAEESTSASYLAVCVRITQHAVILMQI